MTRKLKINGTIITFQEYGDGIPLILLHGFAEDHQIWNGVITGLQNYARIICPDLPGYGDSEALETSSIDAMADMIYQLLREMNINNGIILGHSMGGYVALAMLEKYPEIFLGIGLIHSTSFADDAVKIDTRKKAITFMNNYGAKLFLETSIPDLYFDKEKNKENIENHIKTGASTSVRKLTNDYEAMIKRPNRSSLIADCLIPVLFICGAHDKAVPLSSSLKQAYLAKESHFHILQQSAHMGILEEADQMLTILKHFIHYIETYQK